MPWRTARHLFSSLNSGFSGGVVGVRHQALDEGREGGRVGGVRLDVRRAQLHGAELVWGRASHQHQE